jgi:carboxymethylenebutenolidase
MGQETHIVEHETSFTGTDGHRIPAFITEQRDLASAPRIVIAPEFYGLTPWIRDVARRLAREGFRCIAVEVFARDMLPPDSTVQKLMARTQRLDWMRAVEDLRSGLRELGHEGKAGVVGFCMGGTLALLLAAEGGLDAAVSCYGRVRFQELGKLRPRHPIELAPQIRCPVLGVYAKKDASIPVADALALEKVLPQGSEVALFDADHAFLNSTRPDRYDELQATLAWAKIEGFFNRVLE